MAADPRALFLVETEAQARSVVRLRSREDELVAISAPAEFALGRLGQKFLVPDDFYEPEETRVLKEESLRRVRALCDAMDAACRGRGAVPEGLFRIFIYQLRHVFDHALFTAWRIGRLLERKPGFGLAYFETAAETVDDTLFFRDESVWSRAAPLVCAARGIAARALPDPEKRVERGWDWRAFFRAPARWLGRLEPFFGASSSGQAVFLSASYSLGSLRGALEAGGEKPWLLKLERLGLRGADARAARRAIADVPPPAEHARWEGVDLSSIIMPRLERLLAKTAPEAAALSLAVERRLRRDSARVVVAATMNWREKAAALAARRLNVPFVVYLHGNMGTRHSEIIEYNDMMFSDLYLVNGPAQKKYCETTFAGSRCRTAAVGSAALDRLRRGLSSEKGRQLRARFGLPADRRVVVYALNVGRDFRFPQYHRSASANFRLERELIGQFVQYPDVHFFVKMFRGDLGSSPIQAWARDRGLANVQVIDSPPFSELLPMADAFVIDFPSTTLCEMALTDKPIVFVNAYSNLDWLDEAKAAIKARAEFCETVEQANAALAAFAQGRLTAKRDDALLRGYGTCEDDGKSLDRAAAARSPARAGRESAH